MINQIQRPLFRIRHYPLGDLSSLCFFWRARFGIYAVLEYLKSKTGKTKLLVSPFTIPEIIQDLRRLGYELEFYFVNPEDLTFDGLDPAFAESEFLAVMVTEYAVFQEVSQLVDKFDFVIIDSALAFRFGSCSSKNLYRVFSFSAFKVLNSALGGAVQVPPDESKQFDRFRKERLRRKHQTLRKTLRVCALQVLWAYFYQPLVNCFQNRLRTITPGNFFDTPPKQKKGIRGGSLFIDEIHELPHPWVMNCVCWKYHEKLAIEISQRKTNAARLVEILGEYQWLRVIGGEFPDVLSFLLVEDRSDERKLQRLTTFQSKFFISKKVYDLAENSPESWRLATRDLYKIPLHGVSKKFLEGLVSALDFVSR